MEEYGLSSFLILLLLELLLGSDLMLRSKSLVKASISKNSSNKFFYYITILCFKLFFIILLLGVISFSGLSFNLFGIKIEIYKIGYFLGALFLISKNLTEFFEIYDLKPKVVTSVSKVTMPIFSGYEVIKHIVYFALFVSFETFALGISLTSNIVIIIWANVIASIVINSYSAFFVSLLHRFYRLRLIFIIFSLLLAINLILRIVALEIDNNTLLAIFVFTIFCEVVSILCSKKHRKTGIKSTN